MPARKQVGLVGINQTRSSPSGTRIRNVSTTEPPSNRALGHAHLSSNISALHALFLWDGEPTRYHRTAALFRPPSPKPIVQLLLQWAFQHHLLREMDIGLRLIGLPYVTSWWQVTHNTSVLRFLAAMILTHAGFSRPS